MLGTRKSDSLGMVNGGSAASDRSSTIPSFHIAAAGESSRDTVHSIVDKHLTMRGDLESDGDILIRGKVIGNIKCKLLIVDADAQTEGGIEAEEVVIRGRAKGTIKAERVRLEKTAVIDCEIAQRSFAAEEGAKIKGSLRFLEEGESIAAKDGMAAAA